MQLYGMLQIMKKEVSLQPEHFSRGRDIEFRINSKKEMQFILQHLADKGTRVALYGDDHNFVLTTLIGANAKGMWLEIGPSPPENKKIMLADEITFVSMHQHVKVQFMTHEVKMVLLEGDETFYMDLPDFMLRIQRRDYFRLSIAASANVTCIIPIRPYNPAKPDEPEILRKVPVTDISGGGLSLLCGEHETELLPKATFHNCLITLPDAGTIKVDIEVRNNIKVTARDESVTTRVGCQLIRLDSQMQPILQSYIINLQSESLVKAQ